MARVEVMEAGHPVPDHNSEAAARRIIAMVADLTVDDLVLALGSWLLALGSWLLALVSGGGSALLTLPAKGLTGIMYQPPPADFGLYSTIHSGRKGRMVPARIGSSWRSISCFLPLHAR